MLDLASVIGPGQSGFFKMGLQKVVGITIIIALLVWNKIKCMFHHFNGHYIICLKISLVQWKDMCMIWCHIRVSLEKQQHGHIYHSMHLSMWISEASRLIQGIMTQRTLCVKIPTIPWTFTVSIPPISTCFNVRIISEGIAIVRVMCMVGQP